MVETAVTLSLTLLLLYGAFDIGLMGYFQLQLDGATFFYTHAYASGASLGSTQTSQFGSNLQALFPSVATANLQAITSAGAPNTQEPVNFIQWGSSQQRFGGASILRPQRVQAQATYQLANGTWNALFSQSSQPVTLSAGNVDARPVVANHDDDVQGIDYNSSTANSTSVDPLVTDDQNVPPYYFNFGFMSYCTDWQGSQQDQTACNGNWKIRSLGLGGYLKDDRNFSTYTSTLQNDGIDQGGTFELVKYHQMVYADFSLYFFTNVTMPSASSFDSSYGTYFHDNGSGGNGPFMGWDVNTVGGGGQLGWSHPLDPEGGCSWC